MEWQSTARRWARVQALTRIPVRSAYKHSHIQIRTLNIACTSVHITCLAQVVPARTTLIWSAKVNIKVSFAGTSLELLFGRMMHIIHSSRVSVSNAWNIWAGRDLWRPRKFIKIHANTHRQCVTPSVASCVSNRAIFQHRKADFHLKASVQIVILRS